MSKEIARRIVSDNNIQKLNYILANLREPEIELDSIKLIYELSLIKPDMLVDHFDNVAHCLNSNNNEVQKLTLLTFSNLANKKWNEVWDCRDKICDIITVGDILVLEAGLLLFIEMAKYGNEEIKNEASNCVSVVLEILPVQNVKNFTKNIIESDILYKEKSLDIISKRTGLQ